MAKKLNEYQTWCSMKQRCYNPNAKAYPYYGGRGISVCKEWLDSFDAFLEHVGRKPFKDYSIDRIDNDGNYEPGNVRWASAIQQSNNRRNCKEYKEPLLKSDTFLPPSDLSWCFYFHTEEELKNLTEILVSPDDLLPVEGDEITWMKT